MKKAVFLALLLAASLGGGVRAQEIETKEDLQKLLQENPYRKGELLLKALRSGLPVGDIVQVVKDLNIPLKELFTLVNNAADLLPPGVGLDDVVKAAVDAGFEPTDLVEAAIEAGISLNELKEAIQVAGLDIDPGEIEKIFEEASPS